MITIYLKQSYNLLKENRFVNGISIANFTFVGGGRDAYLSCLPSKFFLRMHRV